MTWLPSPAETKDEYEKRKADFIALYGEDLWNQIQDLSKPRPLSAREVFKPRKPPPERDRPALQTEDSEDPNWWEK